MSHLTTDPRQFQPSICRSSFWVAGLAASSIRWNRTIWGNSSLAPRRKDSDKQRPSDDEFSQAAAITWGHVLKSCPQKDEWPQQSRAAMKLRSAQFAYPKHAQHHAEDNVCQARTMLNMMRKCRPAPSPQNMFTEQHRPLSQHM